MRAGRIYGDWREECTVSLNRLGVKSSSKQCVRRRRRRRRKALRRLVTAAGRESRRQPQQMAGESGERKRLPNNRSSHDGGGGGGGAGGAGGEERAIGNLGESAKSQAGPATSKERRGKENNAGKLNPAAGKMKMEDTAASGAAEQTDLSVFFDEDSNHIFPVEQFFGNLDTVQDFSQRTSTATEGISRREYRRRHYYAKDDSDEEQT
ncbi:UPF0688 protein C1orf174 homolog [Salminus brasiliensis]|uniref:UPF0688 protein C1orf174 homolog n=1 Tax=Salminus brasiliensis TaxID=930266 RepID=UPI003B82EB9C